MPFIWKSFFDFDTRLSNSSKWNDNELMFKWNKEKELPIPLKVKLSSSIVKYLVLFSSKSIALMTFLVLEIAGFAIWVNLTCFQMAVYLNSLSFIALLHLTWIYRQQAFHIFHMRILMSFKEVKCKYLIKDKS